jgi:hypothetical protein
VPRGSWFDKLTTNGKVVQEVGREVLNPVQPQHPVRPEPVEGQGVARGSWFDKLTTNGKVVYERLGASLRLRGGSVDHQPFVLSLSKDGHRAEFMVRQAHHERQGGLRTARSFTEAMGGSVDQHPFVLSLSKDRRRAGFMVRQAHHERQGGLRTARSFTEAAGRFC